MSTNNPSSGPDPGEFVLYQTEDGTTRIEVRMQGETVWLSQAAMAELFQTSKQNVSLHVRNIFDEGELREDSVVKEYLTTAADGKNYAVQHYNLEVTIAVTKRANWPSRQPVRITYKFKPKATAKCANRQCESVEYVA